jgi:hypothetical protein
MRWAIVSDKIETFYESDVKVQYGGEWGSMNHVPVPENMDWTTVSWNGSELVSDPAKLAAKTQAQWASVRAQQRQKLYESDWTCSVTDYGVPDKELWVTYRQALRDVTTQADPFNIEWPVAPSSA